MADEADATATSAIDRDALRRESMDVSAAIIDEILSGGGEALYKHYLDDRLSQFAVRMAMEEMLEVVKWHFMSRDEGEGSLAEKPSWQIDEEPEPAEIDSWARGALRTRKKPAPSPPPTGASVADKREVTRRSNRTSRRPSTDNKAIPTSGMESPASAGSRAVSTATATQAKKKTTEVKPPTAAERQKKLLDEAKAKRAAEEKQELDKLAKIQRELKGKEYIYDRNGDVVVIDELDASKLPAHSVNPMVNIKTGAKQDFSDEVQALKKVMGAARTTTSAGDAEKARAAALMRQQEQQPPAIETMDVVEGVTLMEAGKSKAGPQRKSDSNHMSRKDFLNYGGGSVGGATSLGGGGGGGGAAMADTAVVPDIPPEPEPEPELEQTFQQPSGGSPMNDTVPLKDLPAPPKASQRQREEQMGTRLRFPRDRPHVNPTLPTRPIMPAGEKDEKRVLL